MFFQFQEVQLKESLEFSSQPTKFFGSLKIQLSLRLPFSLYSCYITKVTTRAHNFAWTIKTHCTTFTALYWRMKNIQTPINKHLNQDNKIPRSDGTILLGRSNYAYTFWWKFIYQFWIVWRIWKLFPSAKIPEILFPWILLLQPFLHQLCLRNWERKWTSLLLILFGSWNILNKPTESRTIITHITKFFIFIILK